MVNCSHCGIEIQRNVFCKPSHKVMFNKLTKGQPNKKRLTISKQVNDTLIKKVKPVNQTLTKTFVRNRNEMKPEDYL